jgi:hypothetical protein
MRASFRNKINAQDATYIKHFEDGDVTVHTDLFATSALLPRTARALLSKSWLALDIVSMKITTLLEPCHLKRCAILFLCTISSACKEGM